MPARSTSNGSGAAGPDCAFRVREGRPVGLRRERDGDWEALALASVGRAWRPWVLRLRLVDGTTLKVRPFLPGEAGLPDCGDRVGGIGDSEQLGNDRCRQSWTDEPPRGESPVA